MKKSAKPLRAVMIIEAGIVLILLIGPLIQYESLADSILHWLVVLPGHIIRT